MQREQSHTCVMIQMRLASDVELRGTKLIGTNHMQCSGRMRNRSRVFSMGPSRFGLKEAAKKDLCQNIRDSTHKNLYS